MIHGLKPPTFGSRSHYAGEGDSFTLLSLRYKRVVLKPPRSSLKHFLTHGHLTAHTHKQTHTHMQTHKTSLLWERQGFKHEKKLLMGAVIHQKYSSLIHVFPLVMRALRAPDKNVNLIQL